MTNQPMTVTDRSVTLRDFAIFQVKLLLDGGKDFVAFWASIVAIALDFIAGRGRRPRLFYSVVRASERFDRWINLHSVVKEMDESGTDQGLLGGTSVPDNFLTEVERLVRGSEADRARAIEMLKSRGEKFRQRGDDLRRRVMDPPPTDEG